MQLDVRTIQEFNDVANTGAERAARALGDMTDTSTAVAGTRAEIVQFGDLVSAHQDEGVTGVTVTFEGDISGSIVLVFDEDDIDALVESVFPADIDEITPDLYQSSLLEVGNIMIGEFVDAWADAHGKQIRIRPPTLMVGLWPDVLGPAASLWDDERVTLTFTSELGNPDHPIDFDLYMFPDVDSLSSIVEGGADMIPFSMDQFAQFSTLMKEGTREAAGKITQMTDLATSVEVSRLTFVPENSLRDHVTNSDCVASVTELQAEPHGYVVFLFDTDSALTLSKTMLPYEDDSEEFTDTHRAAIEEIGNIMTSGLIDGWANTLETGMLHEPPHIVERPGADLLTELASQVESAEEYAMLMDSTISTTEHDINCDIFALPRHDEFERLLSDLS